MPSPAETCSSGWRVCRRPEQLCCPSLGARTGELQGPETDGLVAECARPGDRPQHRAGQSWGHVGAGEPLGT